MAKNKAQASKKSAPETALPKDVIIEGEVSARDDEPPITETPAPQKPHGLGAIFAICFSLVALGLASFLVYDRQNSADAQEAKFALIASQMAELQNQRHAQAQAQAQALEEAKALAKSQAAEITKLGTKLQEAILAQPAAVPVTNPRQPAGLIALMMWQDMRTGQALDVYQPFIMALSDEDAKKTLTAVSAAWESLNYQGLLAQGRGFLDGGQGPLGAAESAGNIQEEGLLQGVGNWVAGLIKLEPLAGQEPAPTRQISEPPKMANAITLDEILDATASLQGAEIAAWRQAVGQMAAQQAQLSALIIDYLTDEAMRP